MADLVVDMTEEGVADPAVAAAAPSDVVVIPADGADGLPSGAVLQPDGSVILTLRYPVVMRWKRADSDAVREERRETLHMYRLNGAAMRAIMSAGAGHTVTVGIAKSCRIAPAVFDRLFDMMDGSDAQAAAQVLSFFLGAGTPTASGPPNSP